MKRQLSILLLLSLKFVLIAQTEFQPTGVFKKDQHAVAVLEKQHEFELAANYYSNLLTSPKLSINQQMQIGINYLRIAKFAEAIGVFKLIINKYYSKFPISRYFLARSYFRNAEFNAAKEEFKTFIDNYAFESDSFKSTVLFEMYECDSMKEKSPKKPGKTLSQLNTLSQMSSPTQDEHGNLYLVEHKVNWTNEDKSALIQHQSIIKVSSDSTLSKNVFKEDLNDLKDVFFSEDGNIIVYTQAESSNQESNNQIMYCRRVEDGWGKPSIFSGPINVKGFDSQNPSLVKIARDYYLIYTSNKPLGHGGFDLYFTELNSDFNVVGDSILPPNLNTSYDEVSPFFNKQNATLYFSSNNPRDNFGGFDIYSYKKDVSHNIVNIGMPYNSGANDCFYRIQDTNGYLVSNRPTPSNQNTGSIYSFEPAKNDMKITVSSNYKELTNYDLSIDEDNLLIYTTDTSELHSISIKQNRNYRIKVRKDNYVTIDTIIRIGNLEEGETFDISLYVEPIISVEGKVYFVDYDSSAPKVKQCVVELIDLSTNKECVLYTTVINKQNRKYSFLLPTDKQVKLKVKAQDYNTYDTTFILQNFKSPGGFINNIQLHQIQKNNVIFLDSMFVLDQEIRTYNDFDKSIKTIASSFNKNEDIKAELTIQLVTSDYSKNEFMLPSSIEDVINKYFTQKIYINKQILKVKTTARNQEWYKLYMTYK